MKSRIRFLHGGTLLALDCMAGVTGLVEQMHATIRQRPLPWRSSSFRAPAHPGPIAAVVYTTVRCTQGAVRLFVDHSLRSLSQENRAAEDRSSGALAARAILNGICGDHLESTNNSLAIPMTLRTREAQLELTYEGVRSAIPFATPRIVVLTHGLCLSDGSWSRRSDTDLGASLKEALGYTPIYVRYNSGRHISTNGRELSELLERLVSLWPVRVESIALLGHSMGGLVARSAANYSQRDRRAWREHLSHVICLGAPHHGASLEKIGHLVTSVVRACPYVEPFAFGKLRSAGIQDLRYGNLCDEDWASSDGESLCADPRTPAPLLDGVAYCFAAAAVGRDSEDPRSQLLGDLLVGVASAMGAHPDPDRHLELPPNRRHVFYGLDHFDLLDHPDVRSQVIDWLTDPSPR